MKPYCPVTLPILNAVADVPSHEIFTDSDEWIVEARSRIMSEPPDQNAFRMRGFFAVMFMAMYIAQGRGALSPILRESFNGRVPADVFGLTDAQVVKNELLLVKIEQKCAELLDNVELDLAHYKLLGKKRPFEDIDEAFVARVRACGTASEALRSSMKFRGVVPRTVGTATATYLLAARNEQMCRELVSRLVTINPSNPIPGTWT